MAESEGAITVLTDTRCEGWAPRQDGDVGPIDLDVFLDGRHAMTTSAAEAHKARFQFRFEWPDHLLRRLEQRVTIRRQADEAPLAGLHTRLVSTRRPWLIWSARDRQWRLSASGSTFRVGQADAMTLAAFLPLSLRRAGESEEAIAGEAIAREEGEGAEIRLVPDSGDETLLRLDEPDLRGALRWRRGRGAGGMWIADHAELETDGLAGLEFAVLAPGHSAESSGRALRIYCDGEPVLEERLRPGVMRKISVSLPSHGYHRLAFACPGGDPSKAFLLRGLALPDPRTDA